MKFLSLKGGCLLFCHYLNKGKNTLHSEPFVIYDEQTNAGKVVSQLECVLQWTDSYQENVHSFVNNISTLEGGAHLTGTKAALTRVINGFHEKTAQKNVKTALTGDDVREGLTGIVSVRIKNPEFQGQTKTKLGNPEVRS